MTSLPNWKLATGQNFIKPTTKPFSATVKRIWWVKVCCFNLYDEFQCSERQRLMCALWWLCCIPKQVLSFFCEESSPVWGVLSPFWENLSPIWGLLSPIWGKIEPCYGIIKPVKWLNTKPNFGNVFLLPLNWKLLWLMTHLLVKFSTVNKQIS